MPTPGGKSEYAAYLVEVFEAFGPIRLKRMFGGYGVYHDDLMFGLVAGELLYLKADAETAGRFRRQGLEQFTYYKRGKPVKLSYYAAPGEVYEDPETAREWAAAALGAARRSAAGRKRR